MTDTASPQSSGEHTESVEPPVPAQSPFAGSEFRSPYGPADPDAAATIPAVTPSSAAPWAQPTAPPTAFLPAAPVAPAAQAVGVPHPGNGAAVVSLVFGIIAAALTLGSSATPLVFLLALVGLPVGISALIRKAPRRGTAIAGVVLCGIALLVCISQFVPLFLDITSF